MSSLPARTPLHDWHRSHRAKLVEFAGWTMPLSYPCGILGEHRATRTTAGLFDVSHMGRIRVRGTGAERYLDRSLTNRAGALRPGEAHYTLLATETGGAVDDAYLYRLAADDFLLVVNAANRSRDWDWLEKRRGALADELEGSSISMVDQTETLAMIALQGPASDRILGALADPARLPPPGRNHHRRTALLGAPALVARTGYTGEALGYEIFSAPEQAVPLWEGLIAAGANAAGLGARDSLRLEAGLPLYGHELGRDPTGEEIPVFANRIARFGVRRPEQGDFPGRAALDRQRSARQRLDQGDPPGPALPRVVQALATPGSRRPLRAGQAVVDGERQVGWVTSGSVVPGQDGPEAIGLALLAANLIRKPAAALGVLDPRGRAIEATLVETHRPGGTPAQ